MASPANRLYGDRSNTIETATYALSGAFVVFYIARQVMKAIVFRKVALDDLFISLATVFAIGLSVTTLLLTAKGFGVLGVLTISRADTIMKGYYASELLYVSSICFSKLSIVVLFYNVVVLRTHRIFILSFGVCILAWSLASVATAAFQCSLPRPWELMTLRCFNTRIFWAVYCTIDVSTEAFIIMLSVDLVAHLRVRMSRKLAVVACFAPRLLVVAAALVRATYLSQVTPHSNPEYELWITTICTQVHVGASICTACIPYMVPFFKSLQGNIWRSYSTRSRTARSRPSHPLDQSPHLLRKREANIRFESPRSFLSSVKRPERVSIISPRIPSPGPISPFLLTPISTLQVPPVTPNVVQSQEARTLSVVESIYDSESNETFDMVRLQTAMCFAPSPIEPPVQAHLSSAATLDVSESFEYLDLLGSPDPRSSSSCHSIQSQHMAANGEADCIPSRQTLPNPAMSHGLDGFAHPVRSTNSLSHPKFSTTPRLHVVSPTILPAAQSDHCYHKNSKTSPETNRQQH